MRKLSYIIIIIFLIVVSINFMTTFNKDNNPSSMASDNSNSSQLQSIPTAGTFPLNSAIYNYLNSSPSRLQIYNNAIALNNGDSANTCVYFISEVLRQTGFNVPKSVCNTTELISLIKQEKLTIIKDYTQLKPGDICFTTDSNLNANGTPSHTYVFMSWVKKGKYDFAYICDNQAKDYNNKIYHVRNISVNYKIDGKDKDPFSFLVRKS
ncbi:MAG: hypothetical protein H7Y18_08405 [Clostridiaceae bacterium]|nr:hypothetical protein [Clostridiaceae bacterium]